MEKSRISMLKTGNNFLIQKEAVSSSSLGISVSRQFFEIWVLAALVALFIQLMTLDVLPILKQDEAQITEYGRLTLDPHSDWSISWWMAENKPLLIWSYLGPLISEGSFLLGGPSGLGPRVASLIGGFFAATMALGWLLARRVSGYAAFGLCLAFMLDPLFVLSQRMARADSWVIGLCLASCWLLSSLPANAPYSRRRWRVLAAGGLASMAAFVWPSAVILYPLILLELFKLVKAASPGAFNWKRPLFLFFYFGMGGMVVAILLLLPVWQNLVIISNDMATMVTQNIDSSKTLQDRAFSLFNVEHWKRVFWAFRRTFSPLFPLLAFAGALVYREKGLVVALIAAIYIIFSSLVYELRVLYLLPYLLALASGIFIQLKAGTSQAVYKRLGLLALGLLLLWSVGISLVVRTALGLEAKQALDRNKLYQAASAAIGPGKHRVFLAFAYEFYFVGRSLGWKLYTPYMKYSYNDQGTWTRDDYKPANKFVDLFSRMDYAIFPAGTVTREVEGQLARSGLHYHRSFRVGDEHYRKKTMELLVWLLQGRVGFLQGKESYGAYVLYARNQAGRREKVSLGSQ